MRTPSPEPGFRDEVLDSAEQTSASPEVVSESRRARLQVEDVSPYSLKPYRGNARTHSRKQRRAVAASIKRFGFTNPVLATMNDEIAAGHLRVEVAKELGLSTIPVIRIEHLSPTELRAYILADNQLALKAGWDKELLAIELRSLIDVGFDIEIAGFEAPEVDFILDGISDAEHEPADEDATPEPKRDQAAVTRRGDLWLLALLWQIYSRCFSLQIHFLQRGLRGGRAQPTRHDT
jgi:hypothetical protein